MFYFANRLHFPHPVVPLPLGKQPGDIIAAITGHKFVISFCVSLELLQAATRKFIFYSYLAVFSLTSSLGIAVGIVITELGAGKVSDLVVNTLQGLAAGTLLYVVMFEVLNRERQKHLPGLLQLTAVLLGFIIMLIIQIFRKQIEPRTLNS